MPAFSRFLFPTWLGLVGAGFFGVWRYESVPGAAAPKAAAPEAVASAARPTTGRRPSDGVFRLDPVRPTIVVFAHPDCPCTRATLDGLTQAMERKPGRARVVVAIVGETRGPGVSANERAARRIPGAVVTSDPQGAEARRRGAATSGQTFVFAPDGTSLFQGGLTAVRGHYGPSAGLDAVAAILRGVRPPSPSAPVFGCSLETEGARD